ncbi:uncharacterized protein C11orf24 homolog [Kryptolebias marmoratus]|uniref:Prostate androgen-regulated mucin-like protein 1 n=1 Tax=Kryptolebias marmoratus TaxID=37003 RepID=A0A3Q3A6W1_KRYMA|nr:uncharacterized protein C11orf24 homolog [Kryptolebias marmoratus]
MFLCSSMFQLSPSVLVHLLCLLLLLPDSLLPVLTQESVLQKTPGRVQSTSQQAEGNNIDAAAKNSSSNAANPSNQSLSQGLNATSSFNKSSRPEMLNGFALMDNISNSRVGLQTKPNSTQHSVSLSLNTTTLSPKVSVPGTLLSSHTWSSAVSPSTQQPAPPGQQPPSSEADDVTSAAVPSKDSSLDPAPSATHKATSLGTSAVTAPRPSTSSTTTAPITTTAPHPSTATTTTTTTTTTAPHPSTTTTTTHPPTTTTAPTTPHPPTTRSSTTTTTTKLLPTVRATVSVTFSKTSPSLSAKKPTTQTPSVNPPGATEPPIMNTTSARNSKSSASTPGLAVVEAAGGALTRQLVDMASLLAVLLFGLLFFVVTVAVFVTQAYESYRRKDYTQVDYLINGMYSDSGV